MPVKLKRSRVVDKEKAWVKKIVALERNGWEGDGPMIPTKTEAIVRARMLNKAGIKTKIIKHPTSGMYIIERKGRLRYG